MTHTTSQQNAAALRAALETPDASHRLQAALSAGIRPDPEFIDVLVARCAVEPDFFVRDMLTWALVRQDRAPTLEALLPQLASDVAQARSQALHTLSKIADPAIWGAITPALIGDADDEGRCGRLADRDSPGSAGTGGGTGGSPRRRAGSWRSRNATQAQSRVRRARGTRPGGG